MKRARSFCSPDKDGIYFRRDGRQIIVKIKGVCLPALIIGPEKQSLIQVLKILNSLRPIKTAFSDYGLNLKRCIEDNFEATLQVMQERCQEEIERVKSNKYTTKKNIADWRAVLRGVGKNPPRELQKLLEQTIEALERVEVKNGKKSRKRKIKKRGEYVTLG